MEYGMGFDLTGRKALVTGASRGIGRAIALAFATAGADVALLARDPATLADVAADVAALGRHAIILPTDVCDVEAVQAAVATAIAALDGLDVVVNNAGGSTFTAPAVDMRASGWDRTLRLNLDAVLIVCQAVGPQLLTQGHGSVINVASIAGHRGSTGMAHYSAAKAAVLSLTRSLAVEWAPTGVRVNSLVPGWIQTDLTEHLRGSAFAEESTIGRVPMARWGSAQEIAEPAVFLASSASSFMTGQELIIDGGLMVAP
jgi:NAD(P)-dependent dehydrogenase (short-subunit alcohol dehydrogenase family)